jgi:3-dehydroquinate synthase
VLEGLGLRLWHDAFELTDTAGAPQVLRGLEEFREHLGGELSLTLLRAIGHGVEVHEVDPAVLRRSLGWLRARAGRA